MTFIVLNKVLNNAGDSIPFEIQSDNVRMIEPIVTRVGGVETSERRRVGAQSRIHTGLLGMPYVDVRETAETIRKLIGGVVIEKERVLQPSQPSFFELEGLALVDTKR